MLGTLSNPDIKKLRGTAAPLTGAAGDYDSLLELIADANYVLLGEATHGTHEFYKARAEITKRLIREKGFTILALEADWPDALRVNRFVQGGSRDQTGLEALGNFKRFPTWMWRNADVLDLVGWLRTYNESSERKGAKAGIYGLDLYSLHSSIDAVIRYLQERDPRAAEAARRRYSCFEYFGDDPEIYGVSASEDRSLSCEDEVVQQVMELQRKTNELLSRDGRVAADELFFAKQNAVVARDAEHYYRAMYRGRPNTWNLRDGHMVETLDNLMKHLREQGERPKAVVWAHNSHLGDARATSMSARGELNVGQLLREFHHGDTFSVGFTTFHGTVTAASNWGGEANRKRVRQGMEDSYEKLFHDFDLPRFQLNLHEESIREELPEKLLERAIGVIYLPETERYSHYFSARLADQFDVVLHFDETRAVEPLERTSAWEKGEYPDLYPSGI
jgi:erythromycin esterase-like protein